jgi:hypothetical protein
MAKREIKKEKCSQTEAPSELDQRRRALTSEANPDETIKRLRTLTEPARRLRELIDASREAYTR